MKENIEHFLDHTLTLEGGYVNDPDDAGGETNYGITRRVYEAYLAERGRELSADESMRDISMDDVNDIYRNQYWDILHCDSLPDGIDLLLADFAVNSGAMRAATTLQRIVGVEPDGHIGPITLDAVAEKTNEELLHELFICRRKHYFKISSIRNNRKFLRGWYNRLNSVYNTAHNRVYA